MIKEDQDATAIISQGHRGAGCRPIAVGPRTKSSLRPGHERRAHPLARLDRREWEYDITTGESLFDPNVKIVRYPVEVIDDEIVVTIGR
jgi:hypothetical protein